MASIKDQFFSLGEGHELENSENLSFLAQIFFSYRKKRKSGQLDPPPPRVNRVKVNFFKKTIFKNLKTKLFRKKLTFKNSLAKICVHFFAFVLVYDWYCCSS